MRGASNIAVLDWRETDLAQSTCASVDTPMIRREAVHRLDSGRDVWDVWPVQEIAGRPSRIGGGLLWMGLTAPRMRDPEQRHQQARIHLLRQHPSGWRDLGPAMPDGFSPGVCEWSGSAWRRKDGRIELHFTAAGRRGHNFTPEQRLFQTTATVDGSADTPRLSGWSEPQETLTARAPWRHPAGPAPLASGLIAALRDPAIFHDPKDGRAYLLYAASLAEPGPLYGGAIGLAAKTADGGWRDLGPIVRAAGLNHELERPHIVHAAGAYHLFWCTQRRMFAPGGSSGPTGLYGASARELFGPYELLNGSGLVLANPSEAPDQAYGWWVDGRMQATGFVDRPAGWADSDGRPFAGTVAPPISLQIQGGRAAVATADAHASQLVL